MKKAGTSLLMFLAIELFRILLAIKTRMSGLMRGVPTKEGPAEIRASRIFRVIIRKDT